MYRITRESAFNFMSSEYAALFRASCATAFQHPIWLHHLYGRLAPTLGAEPVVIAVRTEADQRLVMLLPLVRRRYGPLRVVEFADLRVSDYAAPVCDPATFAAIVADKQARDAVRKLLKPYDLLRIGKVAEATLPIENLLGTSPRSQLTMSAHAVSLCESYTQWRQSRIDPSYRKELDKKHRKLTRKGDLRFECVLDPERIKASLHALRHYRGSRFADDVLKNDNYFNFYLETALYGAESGFCRTYALTIDGKPIAVVWGVAAASQFLVLMSGFDLDSFKTYSIGAVTFGEVARDCIEKGDTALDFTIGDESYKSRFGAQRTSMWTTSAAGSPFGSVVNVVASKMPGALKFAKEFLRRKKPATVLADS